MKRRDAVLATIQQMSAIFRRLKSPRSFVSEGSQWTSFMVFKIIAQSFSSYSYRLHVINGIIPTEKV